MKLFLNKNLTYYAIPKNSKLYLKIKGIKIHSERVKNNSSFRCFEILRFSLYL